MALRSGEHGYGWMTKLIHWAVVLLVAAQFAVGRSLDRDDDCDLSGEERGGGDLSDAAEERLDRLEDACEARADQVDLGIGVMDVDDLHVLLGLSILVVAVIRPLWRRFDGFPPWSEHLSEHERRLVHWTERALMLMLFVVPLSGLLLRATEDDDWLPLHVGAQVTFLVVLAAHLFTNLRPKILRRMV